MKKLAIILAFMLIPCTAFGLQMLDDSTMDGITGQSGVSIAFDDIQLFINIGKLAWIDCDGLDSTKNIQIGTCDGGAGAIGMNNFQIDVLNINAIVSSTYALAGIGQTQGADESMELYSATCGQIDLFYDYGATGQGGCFLTGSLVNGPGLNNYISTLASGDFQARALTIDATREMPVMSAIYRNNEADADLTFGGIVIGIPTMEIYINSMSLTPYFTADINDFVNGAVGGDDVVNNNEDFGTIYIEDVTFTTLSGWLEIGPH